MSWELSTWTSPPLSDDPALEFQFALLTVEHFLPGVIDRVQERYRVGPLFNHGVHEKSSVDQVVPKTSGGRAYSDESRKARRGSPRLQAEARNA